LTLLITSFIDYLIVVYSVLFVKDRPAPGGPKINTTVLYKRHKMDQPSYPVSVSTAILLLVDPQLCFGEAVPVPGVKGALENMERATGAWRKAGGRVWFTQHAYQDSSEVGRVADFLGDKIYQALREGSPLAEFHPGLHERDDRVVIKTRFDATRGTNLVQLLTAKKVETVVVAGLTTPVCVAGTAEGLMAADFKVVVLGDACASQATPPLNAKEAHNAAIARLSYIYAQVLSTAKFTESR
jgi:nicotinamidase-related amidase